MLISILYYQTSEVWPIGSVVAVPETKFRCKISKIRQKLKNQNLKIFSRVDTGHACLVS